jgi:hypothetical protein
MSRAAQRVAQGHQQAQLIRDPLDVAAVIDHRIPPGPRYDAVDRGSVGVGEEAGLAVSNGGGIRR